MKYKEEKNKLLNDLKGLKDDYTKLEETYKNKDTEKKEIIEDNNTLKEKNNILQKDYDELVMELNLVKSKVSDNCNVKRNKEVLSPKINIIQENNNIIKNPEEEERLLETVEIITQKPELPEENKESPIKKIKNVKFQVCSPDENKNNEFTEKIKLFSNKKEDENDFKKLKSEEINKVLIKEEEISDKNKEERMNKALKRLKKQREKSAEEEAKRDKNDIKFKSLRIKNMANLLEEQMNKNNNEEIEDNEASNSVEKEKSKIQTVEEMIKNQPGKIIMKKKIIKKKFEE